MPTKLTPDIITAAILGFEEQKRHLDSQIAALRAILARWRRGTIRYARTREAQAPQDECRW